MISWQGEDLIKKTFRSLLLSQNSKTMKIRTYDCKYHFVRSRQMPSVEGAVMVFAASSEHSGSHTPNIIIHLLLLTNICIKFMDA